MSVSAAERDTSPAARADRTIRGQGTAEKEWGRWAGWRRGVTCELDDIIAVGQRLVVVAPHPDDETVGAGGLIYDAVRAGRHVLVVGVTDGGASHPGSRTWPSHELIEQRRLERFDALHCLGVELSAVRELGIADGVVSAAVDEVFGQVRGLLGPEDVVVSPWRYDGHPDHEATALAAERAAAKAGASHLQVPIWGWHWADPGGEEIPSANALIYPLEERTCVAKVRAVDCFTSQLTPDPSTGAGPILPDWALRRMLRQQEVLLLTREDSELASSSGRERIQR